VVKTVNDEQRKSVNEVLEKTYVVGGERCLHLVQDYDKKNTKRGMHEGRDLGSHRRAKANKHLHIIDTLWSRGDIKINSPGTIANGVIGISC
jgi:hypothetical protein